MMYHPHMRIDNMAFLACLAPRVLIDSSISRDIHIERLANMVSLVEPDIISPFSNGR